jgi:PIN domain nuclease of toxin-antitoxin system
MDDETSDVFVSVASIWELSIKFGLRKLPEAANFIADLRGGDALEGFIELAITRKHALHAGLMEIEHRDPFDRMLIAQAQLEGLSFVSNERLFDRFGVARIWD